MFSRQLRIRDAFYPILAVYSVIFAYSVIFFAGFSCAQELVLRGETTFRYYGFKVYRAKVFTLRSNTDFVKALGKEPVRLELTYTRSLKAKDFIESGEAYMKENKEIPFKSIQNYSEEMNKLYKDVNEGDTYTISFVPNDGVRLFLNGVFQGHINDDRFAKAYLLIWDEDVYQELDD